nr:laminin G domain-containing protein [Nostoc sp. EkiNYC01]
DLLVISDSASNVIKKLKWSTVKNYFQSGGSLAPWKYINSNYLASVAERLMIDASSPVTIALPGNPQIGQEIEFSVIRGSGGVNIAFNGNKYLGFNPLITSLKTLKTPAKLIYESSGNGWFCTNPDLVAAKSYELEMADNSPWVYSRLNETSGTSVADSSGNGRNGTYQGGVTLQQSGRLSYSSNKAVQLNGSSGYISFPASLVAPNIFAFECGFKTTASSGSLLGFSINQLTGGGTFDREVYLSSGKLRFSVFSGSTVVLETPLAYNDGNWHTVTVTLSGSGMRIFVDGALKAFNSTSSGASYTGYPHIGYSVTGGYFNGFIDEASICLSNIPSDSKIIQQHLSASA